MITINQMSILSHRGYSVAKKDITPEMLREIKRELTIIPFVEKPEYANSVKPIQIYQETEKRLYMPRFYGQKKMGKADKDKLADSKPMKINLKTTLKLREYQIPFVDQMLASLKNIGGGTLSLACGLGKTACGIFMGHFLGNQTAVVCHTTDLMNQWKERIEQFLPDARIGIVQQNRCQVQDRDFVIISLKTLAQKSFSKDQFRSIGLVIWDEIHLMCTNLFSNAFPKIATKYTLGLSATPFRKDKCDIIFQNYIGPVVVYKKRPKNSKLVVQCVTYMLDDIEVIYSRFGQVMYTSTVVGICNNEKRSDAIVKVIIELVKEQRKILVLSEYIKHLKTIKKKLDAQEYQDFTSGLYIGEMKNKDRKISQKCDVILGTYKLASVGMDIPDLNTLILASPRKDIEQSVGRILRKEQKLHPMIVDIIDNHNIFKTQSRTRKKFYKEYGYTLQYIRMSEEGDVISKRKMTKHISPTDDISQSKIKQFLIKE